MTLGTTGNGFPTSTATFRAWRRTLGKPCLEAPQPASPTAPLHTPLSRVHLKDVDELKGFQLETIRRIDQQQHLRKAALLFREKNELALQTRRRAPDRLSSPNPTLLTFPAASNRLLKIAIMEERTTRLLYRRLQAHECCD